MAKLSDEIITKVLELEKQLLLIINESTKTTFTILEIYGDLWRNGNHNYRFR